MTEFKPPFEPLLFFNRNGISEVVIYGAISWAHGHHVIHSAGGESLLFGRSLMKPFQVKVFANDLKELTPESLAISIGSHTAEHRHVTAAQAILAYTDHSLVRTPVSQSHFAATDSSAPSQWNHPCSGKHAAIIKGSKARGWSTADYMSVDHPYHKSYLDEIRKVLGPKWTPAKTATDGCGLPTVSMTVSEMALLYSSLSKTRDHDFIWNAMVDRPEWIGGEGRMDSSIITEGEGKLIAKEGADGLLGLSIAHKDYPEGLGVVIKTAHGYDPKMMAYLAHAVLSHLGFKSEVPKAPQGQDVVLSPRLLPMK